MLKQGVIALDLRGSYSREAESEWMRDVLDQVLCLLRDLFAAGGEPERIDLAGRLDAFRSALGAGEGAARTLGAQCLSRCREALTHAKQQELDRRQEMAALVAVVREAVVTIGAEVDTLQSSIGQSADRFEAIGALNDPRQIKARLVAEVTTLKKVTVERQLVWAQTSQKFSERVQLLERQLILSRSEASLDPLTGVANRRTFDRTCQEWIRAPRPRFVLAILDVDDFKVVNDTHGHAIGDQVLVTLAQTLLRAVRPGDLVARLGGDEFAILATDLTLRQAEGRFAKTIAAMSSPGAPGTAGWLPNVSCGLAEYSAGDTHESLFERADHALYTAKRAGKHRVSAKARAFIRDLMKR